MVLKPQYRMIDFRSQVEAGGVFAVERYQVPAEDHVVTDENGHSRAELNRERAIVGRAQAQSRHAVPRILIRKLQHAEEGQTVPTQRELFFSDGDLVQMENVL